jgi:hypothetical protein
MFTKCVTTEPNLVNGEKDYYDSCTQAINFLIPDKLLAVGPNNELFYFKVEHKSDLTT